MPTDEQLKEWQEQQDALKEQLKAQIDRSLVTKVKYHFKEETLVNGKKIIDDGTWEMTIHGLWQDRPTKDSA